MGSAEKLETEGKSEGNRIDFQIRECHPIFWRSGNAVGWRFGAILIRGGSIDGNISGDAIKPLGSGGLLTACGEAGSGTEWFERERN